MRETPIEPQTLTVTIPAVIERAMTLNGRGHWRRRYAAERAAKHATAMAMSQAIDLEDPRACFQRARWPLTLDWEIGLAKGRRRMDMDNAIGGLKSVQDQIARCLGMDDRFMVTGTVTQVRDPEGLGFVRVTITEARP